MRWPEQTAGVCWRWIGQSVLNHRRRLRFLPFSGRTTSLDLQDLPRARWRIICSWIFWFFFLQGKNEHNNIDCWEFRLGSVSFIKIKFLTIAYLKKNWHWYRELNSGRKRYCKLRNEFANTALSDGKKELIDQLETIFRTECVRRRVENCATKTFYILQ